jgi:uncharacterized protein (DUF362 family)
MDHTIYITGVKSDDNLKNTIEDLFLKSTNNLEWLHPGELVLLKPALNSAHTYPSTTHPLAVQVISNILQNRGAEVVIGDQSGIRSVLHHPAGLVHGKTRDNFLLSGMADKKFGKNSPQFIGFEERGWDEGFFHYKSPKTSSWSNGFFITKWIKKSDHIINLPRISTHTQAGATLGFKNMIGLLRDDSRMEYHANGPYNYLIKLNARKSSLKSNDDHSGKFMEKIVEISDAVRDKLRLTLFISTKAQTTFGPDSYTLKLGKLKFARSYISKINPGLLMASQDPVAVEACALALLKFLRKQLPMTSRLYERIILFSSYNTGNLDEMHIKDNPYIKHAIRLEMGNLPSQVEYKQVPTNIKNDLNALMDLKTN